MTQAIAGFFGTWAPSYQSTMQRLEVRNVRQGGNEMLAAMPLVLQTTWAGGLMSKVAAVVEGPLQRIARFFSVVFSLYISFPLLTVSCAVKAGYYESSVSARAVAGTKHYAIGELAVRPVKGTVTLQVDGKERHFLLGDHDISEQVETRVVKYVERKVGEAKACFQLEREVNEPIQGTVAIKHGSRVTHHVLNEIPEEAPGCVTIKWDEMNLFYNTGAEIDEPTENSQTFVINGVLRHFASAQYSPYETLGISGWFNQMTSSFINCSILPTRLSTTGATALKLINQHLSNIIRVAIVVSGVVLLYFGQVAMAAGALSSVGYEYLDRDLAVIPLKVSIFMEKWMPYVSTIGLLLVGSLFDKIVGVPLLLSQIPRVKLFLHHRLSEGARRVSSIVYSNIRGPISKAFLNEFPTLEEFDAPFVDRRIMNAREIDEILNGNDADYEVNPAYFQQDVEFSLDLPKDMNFSKLTALWDEIGERWNTTLSYNRLLKRLVKDNLFILFLKKRFPEAKKFSFVPDRNNRMSDGEQTTAAKGLYLQQVDEWIHQIAEERGMAKHELVVSWIKEQLNCFVSKLELAGPSEGNQRFLRDAIENVSKIIPFLTREGAPSIEQEDSLIKLAIEGGNYCSIAMKRVSEEVLNGFTVPLINEKNSRLEAHERFENEVFQALKTERFRALQSVWQRAISFLQSIESLQDTASDVHLYEKASRLLSRTFYPMTSEELGAFDMSDVVDMEMPFFVDLRVEQQKMFIAEIPRAINVLGNRILGRSLCLDYLRDWVQNNGALSDLEKSYLLDEDLSEDLVVMPEPYPKWNRLMLIILGIYRKKEVQPAEVAAPVEGVSLAHI